MTAEKLKTVLQFYRELFDLHHPKVGAVQLTEFESNSHAGGLSRVDRIAHWKFMCDEARRLDDKGQVDDAMRWLGFLQGVLWMDDEFSFDELKKHSTSES